MMPSHTTASGCAHVNTKSYGLIHPPKPGTKMCQVKMGVAITGTRNPRNRTRPAAMDAKEEGRPTIECIQPNRNPQAGPKPRRKYAYSPPASGIAAPSSAYDSAPN